MSTSQTRYISGGIQHMLAAFARMHTSKPKLQASTYTYIYILYDQNEEIVWCIQSIIERNNYCIINPLDLLEDFLRQWLKWETS